jgi:hypothetical protein
MDYNPLLDEEELDMEDQKLPDETVSGPQTRSDEVKQRILAVRNPLNNDANVNASMDFAKNNAMTAGIGRGLNALAGATGYKADNSGYDQMEKSGQDMAEKSLTLSAQVQKAIEDRKAKAAEFAASQEDKKRQQANIDRRFKLQEEQLAQHAKELGLKREERQVAKEERLNKGTADQFKVAGFGKRIEQAESVFDDLEKNGYNRAGFWSGAKAMLPNMAQDSNTQKQSQEERNFINAVLRRESGAAISPTEFTSAEKQYFPRAGDSDGVVAQKRANRLQVLASLKAEAGPTWDKIPSIEAVPTGSGSGGLVNKAYAGGGRVTITNGKETHSIPLEDLPAAMKDGFQPVGKK